MIYKVIMKKLKLLFAAEKNFYSECPDLSNRFRIIRYWTNTTHHPSLKYLAIHKNEDHLESNAMNRVAMQKLFTAPSLSGFNTTSNSPVLPETSQIAVHGPARSFQMFERGKQLNATLKKKVE